MTNPAAISGDYVDLKFIKSRKVCQIVIEVPIEAGSAIVQAFGTPQPHEGVPVALARLESRAKPAEPAKPKEMSRAQRAGMLCQEPRFRAFIAEREKMMSGLTVEGCANFVRVYCNVQSRADLDLSAPAARKWDRLRSEYEAWLKVPV